VTERYTAAPNRRSLGRTTTTCDTGEVEELNNQLQIELAGGKAPPTHVRSATSPASVRRLAVFACDTVISNVGLWSHGRLTANQGCTSERSRAGEPVTGSRRNPSVFLSYRRDGGGDLAQVIKAFLEGCGVHVFLDVDDLGSGHFDEQIFRKIEATDVFILICSKGCFDGCVDPDDWVRRELEHAISLAKRIVPVVTREFCWPRQKELPESIRAVIRHNAFEYSHNHWKLTRARLLNLIGVDSDWTAGAPPQPESTVLPSSFRSEDGVVPDTHPSSGSGIGEDFDSSRPLDLAQLTSLADQGDADAQRALGAAYQSGNGVEQSDLKAVDCYLKAAKQGHADAQYRLAWMYAAGRGVERSNDQALAWLRLAAEQGHAQSRYSIGGMYANGQGVVRNAQHAAEWYRKAAEQGHADARFILGGMYEAGQGVEKCARQAIVWWQMAAEQGHANAQVNLGFMYTKGQGVEVSDTQSVFWFRKAAEQGNELAQFNLGLMYKNGRGVEPSSKLAAVWFQRAAEQGYLGAQCNLASLFESGQGVKQSDKQAVFWYRKAAEQGDAFAQARLAQLLELRRGFE